MRREKIKNFLKEKYFQEIIYPRREKILSRWREKKEVFSSDLPFMEALMKDRIIRGIGIFRAFELISVAVPPSHNYTMYHSYDTLKVKFERNTPEIYLRVLRHHIAYESCGIHCERVEIIGDQKIWERFLYTTANELEEKKGWWVYLTPSEEEGYLRWLEITLYNTLAGNSNS